MTRNSRTILFAVVTAAATLGALSPSLRAEYAVGTPADARIQQDPKRKEITATIRRSLENETIVLSATFPEDYPELRVSLFNLLGRLIEEHPARSVTKGTTLFQFATKGLPNGPYIVVLEAGGQRVSCKVMVSH